MSKELCRKRRHFLDENVLDAARKRIAMIFDNFNEIHVSTSSGKDSTVLYFMCLQEAIKRGRKIVAFFLDQEAEYQASINQIKILMKHSNVIPRWYQVPIFMTNATSTTDYFLYAWGEGETWMRAKDPIAIHEINENYPKRFYPFFEWYEKQQGPKAAHLIGLRADEGINRFRAVTKNPGWQDIKWSTTASSGAIRFYPLYDWGVNDIWKYVYDFNLPYNKIYDLMFWANYSTWRQMRVSNLIHERAFKCLVDLPKFEPDTYNALCKRIAGIRTASRYAAEKLVFNNKVLPKHYEKWQDFRDFLLEHIPNPEHKQKFTERFNKQSQNERTYQAQVGQLLIYDFENSRPFDTRREEKVKEMKEKWWKLL